MLVQVGVEVAHERIRKAVGKRLEPRLAIVVAGLRFYETGRGLYLILAAISAALMVATKETWIMNGPVLVIAWISTAIYFWVRESLDRARPDQVPLADRWRETIDRLGGFIPLLTIALTAFAVFIVVSVLFYSSFFKNYPKGVSDGLRTLNLWRQRTHEHEHPWWQYIYWLVWEEGALIYLRNFIEDPDWYPDFFIIPLDL